jgi:hypothetical protein
VYMALASRDPSFAGAWRSQMFDLSMGLMSTREVVALWWELRCLACFTSDRRIRRTGLTSALTSADLPGPTRRLPR